MSHVTLKPAENVWARCLPHFFSYNNIFREYTKWKMLGRDLENLDRMAGFSITRIKWSLLNHTRHVIIQQETWATIISVHLSVKIELRHAKRSPMAWVGVIPKEGWALLLVWHRPFRIWLCWHHIINYLCVKEMTVVSLSPLCNPDCEHAVIFSKSRRPSFFWYDNNSGYLGNFLRDVATIISVHLSVK